MRTAMKLAVGLLGGGGAGATNSVPAAISATSTIGTQNTGTPGTWTGSPVLTYQWQRNTGSWVDIGGATALNRTPVDADFGYALRVLEIPNGNVGAAVASNVTGLTLEAPVQSLGSNLFVDGDAEAVGVAAWINAGGNATLTKTTSTPFEGAQALSVTSNGGLNPSAMQNIGVNDTYYELDGVGRGNGTATPRAGGENVWEWSGSTSTSWQEFVALFRRTIRIGVGHNTSAAGNNADFDALRFRAVTLNTQLVAPSANMLLTQLYTPPVSPVKGHALWLMARVSDFATGNYWLALLIYTGSQWDITAFSVASHTRTSRITATNIGDTNGVRINMNADSITLETRNGSTWTQRGSTISNSLYNTATGANVLAASAFTLSTLGYADPN